MLFVANFLVFLETVTDSFCTRREFAFFALGLCIGFFISKYIYMGVKDTVSFFGYLSRNREREKENREKRRIDAEKSEAAEEEEKAKKKLAEERSVFNELIRKHRLTRLDGGFFSTLDGTIICPECLYNSDVLVRMKHEHVPVFGRIDFVCPVCGYIKVPHKACTLKPIE